MKHRIPLRHSGLALFAAVGFVSCGVAAFSSGSPVSAPVEDPTPDQIAFFETKIRPVLAKNCYGCHGAASQTAGLRVDTIEGLLKSQALVKGDPEKSTLIHVVRYTGPVKMPPSGKLKPTEIANLEAWVKMGAPWPKAPAAKRKQDEFLWSLQKVKKPAVPKVKAAGWVKNPIDAFVLAKLEAKGLAPAPAADRRTLIRRVTYDLIGLPPTAAEIQAFVADKSPNAYEKVVDRLLASPRYGERWARQWLDVARYADTKGYVFEEDRNYPNAYTYREWVIKAFNSDLPYDQFITQQLAADRLPEVQNGDDKSALAAMGFLTVGRRFLNSTPDIIDDRIDVTMRGFQGFTVSCARCHDHKFDPIPTQDYYSLYAVFDSSEERILPISRKEIREPWERFNAHLNAAESAKRELVVAQTKRLRGLTDLPAPVRATLQGIREETVPEGGNLDKLAPSFEPAARDRLAALQKEIKELRDNPPVTPEFAMAMNDRGDAHDGVVFKRGNPGAHGEPAPRRFLLALSDKAEREHWTAGSGRLELAKAIASKENPLTARVFVNRIWMGHFGAAIVRTPSDFGHQGDKPTDPELLDYLASSFMENGWSIKRLHRLIVTSAIYRQSADASPKLLAADPDNRLWGRMNRRRLDLEQMRDTLLAATGRLDLSQVGGKSVDLWSRPFTPRRAVYGFIERQNLPGIFRTFDYASPDSTSARRFQTTVPQQALFFLNSPFSVEAAEAVAARKEIAGATDDGQRVRRLYLLLFGRLPDADETAAGLGYLKQGQPEAVGSAWQYGYGEFAQGKTTFRPFANYVDRTYRFAPTIPDKDHGYLNLNQGGGHPGPKVADGAIRRWVAPATMTVSIRGVVQHPNAQGDGVRARIVSSRTGLLGEWTVHHGEAKAEIASVTVQKGEAIDFIVDPFGNDAFDSFAWSPTIQGSKETWDASANFGPPSPAPLSRLTLYAQALMMTNEFMFVD
jgi:mono/diheme cytochrome c family protein